MSRAVPFRLALVLGAMLVAAANTVGCASPTFPDDAFEILHDGYTPVQVFYGTDREPTGLADHDVIIRAESDGAAYGGQRGSLHYGTLVVTIPARHTVGEIEAPGWFEDFDPEEHFGLFRVRKRAKAEWLELLKERLDSVRRDELLVFIHGFNVSFRSAALRTAQIHYDLEFPGVPVLYSWPSEGDFENYLADEGNVEWSQPHLVEFLNTVARESGATGIHVVAHSMGSRVLARALQQFAEQPDGPPIRQVILAAPDLDRDIFVEQLLPSMRGACDALTLYASADDRALVASSKLHEMARAGQGGEDRVVAAGLVTVDITGIDPGIWELGHSTFAKRERVINDIATLLRLGLPPESRDLDRRGAGSSTYWVFP